MEKKYVDAYESIREYVIDRLENLLKEPRVFIHYPFIDPGSVYDGNVWDWDTYWSVYGLLPLATKLGDEALKANIVKHAKGNVYNFFDHQLEDGYIPMMIEVASWPEPYLNMKHKAGKKMNMHKPFLVSQICLISDYIEDYTWAKEFEKGLEKYFRHYDENYFNENCGLYVWHDDIMIGMDNDPASFGRPYDSTANIFLNSFMIQELESYMKYLKAIGRKKKIEKIKEKRDLLEKAIHEECFDKRDKFFYSVDVDIKTRRYDWFHEGLGVFWKTLPIKIRTWSGFLPMALGFATAEEARELVKHYRDDETFHSPYGVCTLAKDEKMFDLSVTNNPSNWLGPIWLVANYLVFKGLLNYGYIDEAREITENTLRLLGDDLKKTGSLHEYYDPFTGKPIMNGGFVNWNMLALNMVDELEEYSRKIIVLDDDPTGVQTVHDVTVFTSWDIESIEAGFREENNMFFILTNSRAMSEEKTKSLHREIAENIAEVSKKLNKKFLIISRGDSTLRGHFPLETQTIRETLSNEGISLDGEIICPYFKEGGRVTMNDIHYVKSGSILVEAAETEFARDETFGYKSSNLKDYVEEKTKGKFKASDCISISLEELKSGNLSSLVEKLAGVDNFKKVIVNATEDGDVEFFAAALKIAMLKGKNFSIRSAASLVKAMGNIKSIPLLSRSDMIKEESKSGGIIIVGSHTKKTTAQISKLMEIEDIEFIEMDSDLVLDDKKLKKEVDRILAIEEEKIPLGVTLCIYTNRRLLTINGDTKEKALERSVKISDAVQALVGRLSTKPSFIIAKGGITSSDIGVKALGVKRALVLGQIRPGVPVWKTDATSKFPDIPYVIFPGNVGEETTLKEAVEILRL